MTAGGELGEDFDEDKLLDQGWFFLPQSGASWGFLRFFIGSSYFFAISYFCANPI